MKNRTLTAKQRRFVDEYLVDLNATRAAVRAGYSARSADKLGPRLVGKSAVADGIRTAVAERTARTQVTQDSVIDELAKVAFSDMRQLVSWGPDGVRVRDSGLLERGASASVAEMSHVSTANGSSTKVRLYDKIAALRLLGQHLGMFGAEREQGAATATQRSYVLLAGQKVFF